MSGTRKGRRAVWRSKRERERERLFYSRRYSAFQWGMEEGKNNFWKEVVLRSRNRSNFSEVIRSDKIRRVRKKFK